ncbi:MAG TPA: DUF4189 domain-containing protein [Candidatus Elarobacter sp.]|jgi:hypothetical protein|nr:DUF4189 domain-containing protein [Candidatus Elarobacter sp.]
MPIRTFVFSLCTLLLVAPSAASAQFITDIPWTNLSGRSPILLTGSSTFNNGDGTVRLCVSFRNVANKTATAARITFELDDLFGHPLREAILDRSGSFAPGIAIEGKMDALGGNADSFNNCVNVTGTSMKPARKKVDVTEVAFADGTKWKKGDGFVQAFDKNGNRIPDKTIGDATTTGGQPGADTTHVEIGGASGVGGSVGPTGALFGTIAWVAGSRTAYGVSADAQSQDDADFAAMTACTQANNGNTGCKIVARMTGTDKKCAAIATDQSKTAIAQGPDVSSTIQAVLATLAKAGGTIDSNSVVANKCNSH